MTSDPNNSSSDSNPPHRVFATTSWSMILEAVDSNASGMQDALAELCKIYWYPLYSFVRRKGFDSGQAEDLTQSFFAELLEKDRLKLAEPLRGSFRSFLLASLNNFISNHWRAENALKRGGGQTILSIDYKRADSQYTYEPTDELTAEKVFERNWALSILEQALRAVSDQYERSGKRKLFESLQGYLTGNEDSYSDLSQSTKMREGALKVAVHRLRQRYGQQLRLQIARTVQDPTEVDGELRALFKALE